MQKEYSNIRKDKKIINIALAGNPNSGKTTIFNALTGARQHVGNWPGVTVEKKEGILVYKNYNIEITDLPGIYSLSAYSIDELIARNFIIRDNPDVVIDVIDASNLERNLYLALELIDLGAITKLIFVFNMYDIVIRRNQALDIDKLISLLGVPIVTTVGTTGKGIGSLKQTIIDVYENNEKNKVKKINYGNELEEEITKLQKKIKKFTISYPERWAAIKLLERDDNVIEEILKRNDRGKKVIEELGQSEKHLKNIFGDNSDLIIADRRYGYISGILRECGYFEKVVDRQTLSDRIDLIITSRVAGIPIFLLLMFITFQITFKGGYYIQNLIDRAIILLSVYLEQFLMQIGSPFWLSSFLIDGVIGGVGGVLIFIPNIFILFFIISLLEDSGYMARAAFIMDSVMHKIGLHGKSFIPLVMGFGCNVPAIMATRTLGEKKDRIITVLIIPFISCSARLPIYILLAAAFFEKTAALVIFSLYLLGIVLAILSSKLFSKVLFKGISNPFVMELPPYRLPTLKGAIIHMWERGSIFLKKMGTVILIGSVAIWLLGALPVGVEYASRDSFAGIIGGFVSNILKPLGFGWIESIALLFGFVAKEIVVGTLAVILHVSEEGQTSLIEAIRNLMTPLKAYTFMVFTLLYTPCLGTIAAVKRETGSVWWTLFSISYSLAVAWVFSFIIYRLGLLFGLS